MTPPTTFDTARARVVAADYPGLPSELLIAAVERLEALGDVSAPAGIIGELAKRLPPTRTAAMLEHIAYGSDDAACLAAHDEMAAREALRSVRIKVDGVSVIGTIQQRDTPDE